MYKSINQWSFPASMPTADCLLAAKRAGFAGFEPAFADEGPLAPGAGTAGARELRALADAEGMLLPSLASGLYWQHPLTAADPAARRAAEDIVRAQLDCAAALGVGAILVVPGTVGRGFWGGSECTAYADAYARAQEALVRLAPEAEACGVDIGVENVWNNFLLSPLEMARFLDEIGSPRVRAYFDVGNVVRTGEPADWIRTLGARITRVHVKDFRRSVDTIAGFCDLLSGDVDFAQVLAALREVGYDGALTAEMNPYAGYPTAMAEQTSRALDYILAGSEG
ncbi:MAG: sugar phosphate isomerase/epimerase family protein [Candidatus Spyradocola sp.]|jgi:L-ribulose-5-phosphate 3-epimerase